MTYAATTYRAAFLLRLADRMQATARRTREAAERLDRGATLRAAERYVRPAADAAEHELFDSAHADVMFTPWALIARGMQGAPARPRPAPATPGPDALAQCTLFLYFGFAGAAMFVAGALQLLDVELRGGTALALVFAGGVLAVRCWREARIALDRSGTYEDRTNTASLRDTQ